MVAIVLRPWASASSSAAWIESFSQRTHSCFRPCRSYTARIRLSHQPLRRTLHRSIPSSFQLGETTTNNTSSLSSPLAAAVAVKDEFCYRLQLLIPTAEDMEDVGALLSQDSRPGDVILLDGDLGAGKTCFSRGFVRARTGQLEQRVTSPTYLLSNTYPTSDGIEIRHMDLYRLSGEEDDLRPLDLDYVYQQCIALIEWPSRLSLKLPLHWLEVDIRITATVQETTNANNDEDAADVSDCARHLDLIPHGKHWEERLRALVDDGLLEDLIKGNNHR